MENLLSERDFQFLAEQPGYKPEMARKLRVERRRICHSYLKSLNHDFNHLYAVAMQSAARSESGGEELVAALVRQKLLFRRSILGIRFSLTLNALGIGKVDAAPAIEAFRMLTVLAKDR